MGGAVGLPCRTPGEWRNWQTRRLQVPVSERMWGFKSPLAHRSPRRRSRRPIARELAVGERCRAHDQRLATLPATGFSIAESMPGDYSLPHPAPDAPNVVLIVLDDLGFGQLGCFGSDIATPAIDGLAAGGLRYNHFHVTSLCSPTRACLMTGRNHHAVGMGFLTDLPMAFPGYTGRIPQSATPLPRVLRDAGYNTLAVGKWHLVPGGERSVGGTVRPLAARVRLRALLRLPPGRHQPLGAAPRARQPLRRAAAAADGDGYHLTEDLADEAIRVVTAQHQAAPDRPFFLYFALGAMHAPHHVAPEWIEPYRGAFDGGWEQWRDERVRAAARDRRRPRGHRARASVPSWIDEWASLSPDAQRMLARQQEVFAGFLSHTDAQIGRVARAARRAGRARQHAGDAHLRQRRQRRGRRARHLQRAPLHRARARHRRGQPRVERRARRHPRRTRTTRGAGRGRATRRCGCGSATRGWAARARR